MKNPEHWGITLRTKAQKRERRYRKQKQHLRKYKKHNTLVNPGTIYPYIRKTGDWATLNYHNGQMKKGKDSYKVRHITPMRPVAMTDVPKEGYIFEPKYDGSRAVLYADKNKGQAFINRRDIDKTKGYPEFDGLYKKLGYTDYIVLDGEVIVPKSELAADFKKLSEREHLQNQEEIQRRLKTHKLKFMAFDIVEKDGRNLKRVPILERKKILDQVIPDNLSEIKEVKYTHDYNKLAKQIKAQGGEGIVAKKADSEYVEGKSKLWLKDKFSKMQDVVVVGYTAGTGKRKGKVGALLTGVYQDGKVKYAGKVGTGLTDKHIDELTKKLRKLHTTRDYIKGNIPNEDKAEFVKPEVVGRVKYSSLTGNGIMREPRWVGERSDIKPTETHKETIRRK